MGIAYNASYSNISQIKGPSGWYWINTPLGPVHTYVNQEYDGGGWAMVMANRINTGGMNNLTYDNAINACNIRASSATTNYFGQKLGALSNYNVWIGLKYWSLLGGRATANKITVVQFVSPTSGTALNATHTKRYRWRFSNFTPSYSFSGAEVVADETGTGIPGFYSSHAVNGRGLSTYDVDQDSYYVSCSSLYNNNPWWYDACWSGNYFAGGSGYQDGSYWIGSNADYHSYGAVYIK